MILYCDISIGHGISPGRQRNSLTPWLGIIHKIKYILNLDYTEKKLTGVKFYNLIIGKNFASHKIITDG